MIINVRGTSGSGKSTAVRKIMEQSPRIEKTFIQNRKNPVYYDLIWPEKTILVPGHYETACGGCDTIKTYDHLFQIIRAAHTVGKDVLFEGLLVAHDKKRCTELWDWLNREPGTFHIIEITNSLETCLRSVEERRQARKKPPTKPFNPDNTVRRYKEVIRSCEQLEALGITIHREKRGEVPALICELLGLPK